MPALGFLGLGPWYYDNGAVEITRADERHDRVDVVSRGFLGLTVGYARCHDHKYDPFTQKDYYAFMTFFNQVPETGTPSGSGQYRIADPWITVGSKGFVQTYRGRVLMKLEKHHQELLFEARPEVFTPMTAGALRWSWVEIDALDADEAAALVREAWTQVVPKRVSKAHLALSSLSGGSVIPKG